MTENEARALIASRLQPGEKLIWFDRPPPWTAVWNGPLFGLVFSCFFLGFSLFWMWGATSGALKAQATPTSFFPLFGLLFVGIGLFQLFSALMSIVACWRTAYGLTDRRVIIAVGKNGPTRSLSAQALSAIERSGGTDRGTLRFGTDPALEYQSRRGYRQPRFALIGIRDPVKVEAAIYKNLIDKQTKGAAI